MTDSYPVYRLTQEAYDQLRLAADENPDSYLDSEIDFGEVLRETWSLRPIRGDVYHHRQSRSLSLLLLRGRLQTARTVRRSTSTGRSTG